jgi:hypothetical protein
MHTSTESNVRTDIVFLRSVLRLLLTANVVPSLLILVTQMMEAIIPPKHRFSQEPYGVTSQKTTFFMSDCNLLGALYS